jgi:hypothetical protein
MSTFKTAITAIKFKGGSYPTNIQGHDISFPDIDLKTALISVSQNKRIVKTDVQGRDGKIKEYIGMDDYQVDITGALTGENNVRPINDMLDLKKILDAPIEISVECPFLNQFGIFNVVVESYYLPEDAGGISYQSFTINCISEIPAKLVISNA